MHFTEKEIIHELEEPKPKKWKKVITISLSVLILLITLSYFLLNPYIISILSGFTETDKLNEQNLVIEKEELTLVFENQVYLTLKELFIQNEGKEFKVCILGNKEESVYHLNQVIVPETYSQEFTRVVAAPCPAGTLIDLHSHPQNHCVPSYHDVQVLKRLKEDNKNIILAVMCNLERFNFYI